ncbi:MAG: metal-dependent hydrolase [Thermoplasmata archaeon]|nr:metal-dependent hydrolase [Thermoplasmata archaeon]
MDLFTHVLFAYLVVYGTFGASATNYIIAGAVAGGLPDGDAFLYPLWKRFPILRHHGITHSIFGVTFVALFGGLVVMPYFLSGSPAVFVLVMELGGLTHVFLDGFTNFSVPPLLPFSSRQFHLDADRAVNFGTMIVTLAAYVLLAYERGRVALAIWEWTAWLLLAFYLGYLAIRALGRWRAEHWRRLGGYLEVLPTGNPLRWLLVFEKDDASGFTSRWRAFTLGRGARGGEHRISVARRTDIEPGRVASEEEALSRTLAFSQPRSRFRFETYRFAEVRRTPGFYEVFWYSLEFQMLGRASGVVAKVDEATGAVVAHPSWRTPSN